MNETLQKGQYLLKRNIVFFLFTRLNLFLIAISYFLADSFLGFLTIYGPSMLLCFKFFFSKTKMDNPYNIFLLKKISDLIKNLRK